MPNLLINDLDDALHAKLEARALAHRRSLADEARETLRDAVADEVTAAAHTDIVSLFTRHFGVDNGVTLDLPSRSADAVRPPPDFSGPEYDR